MKKIVIHHDRLVKGKPYALIPIGRYLNSSLQKARRGTRIEFQTGWGKEVMTLKRRCRIEVESSVFLFMAQSLYGAGITVDEMRSRWRAESVIEGYGRNGFNEDECILIEVE